MAKLVHNDFHQTNGIFPLFDGLCVNDINKTMQHDINGNEHSLNEVEEAVESTANAAIANGINDNRSLRTTGTTTQDI
jgi:methylenetetrahydrofolate reductase (NADPH)